MGVEWRHEAPGLDCGDDRPLRSAGLRAARRGLPWRGLGSAWRLLRSARRLLWWARRNLCTPGKLLRPSWRFLRTQFTTIPRRHERSPRSGHHSYGTTAFRRQLRRIRFPPASRSSARPVPRHRSRPRDRFAARDLQSHAVSGPRTPAGANFTRPPSAYIRFNPAPNAVPLAVWSRSPRGR
jgi:hypothetical protein